MSDKLVVEFCEEGEGLDPVFAVMSLHGGDNPVSASLTISDFLAAIRASSQPRDLDAHRLASRFILWSSITGPSLDFPNPEAELIPISSDYGYQTVRIFSGADRIRVELVRDEFATDEEIAEGNRFLKLLSVS